jgi:hypothetical protein
MTPAATASHRSFLAILVVVPFHSPFFGFSDVRMSRSSDVAIPDSQMTAMSCDHGDVGDPAPLPHLN